MRELHRKSGNGGAGVTQCGTGSEISSENKTALVVTRCPTEFEQRVYKAVQGIPAGKVVTYTILADLLNCRSAQAIGQALKRNPSAPTVPCHRVI
ncbi:MAG: MGMT family protein [Akkermansiaceae bacterium]